MRIIFSLPNRENSFQPTRRRRSTYSRVGRLPTPMRRALRTGCSFRFQRSLCDIEQKTYHSSGKLGFHREIEMFRAPIAGLVGVVFSLLVCSASMANTQPARDADTAAHSRLNAGAQMISGLSPAAPALNAFMQSSAWEEHRAFMHAAWKRLKTAVEAEPGLP